MDLDEAIEGLRNPDKIRALKAKKLASIAKEAFPNSYIRINEENTYIKIFFGNKITRFLRKIIGREISLVVGVQENYIISYEEREKRYASALAKAYRESDERMGLVTLY